ncbi:MAG: dicarboxylate/amino acid:cation symporter [Bacillota bacterium]
MKKISLLNKILLGLVLGIAAGVIFGPSVAVVKPLGDLFLRLIRMVIVPLVFASLVVGAASTGDVTKLGRIGGKTISYYLVTTAIAVTLGLVLGNLIKPGLGLNLDLSKAAFEAKKAPAFVDTMLNLFPTNPLAAMVEGNMLQIIVFALFVGVAITLVGQKAKPALEFFDSLAEVMYKITGMVMAFAPYGIFGLIAPVVGRYGLDIIMPLIKLILAVYIGGLLHALVVYSASVSIFAKMSPVKFFKGIFPATALAFSSTSSAATLPVTIKSTEDNLGVSKGVSSFVLPLGATVNMDGTALYQGICALFVAQVYGLELTMAQQLQVVLAGTLASIGAAGVPGAGLIMLTMVLTSVGLPLEGVGLVAGIDRILDMMRTAVNVTGDASAAVVVAATEGELQPTAVAEGPGVSA